MRPSSGPIPFPPPQKKSLQVKKKTALMGSISLLVQALATLFFFFWKTTTRLQFSIRYQLHWNSHQRPIHHDHHHPAAPRSSDMHCAFHWLSSDLADLPLQLELPALIHIRAEILAVLHAGRCGVRPTTRAHCIECHPLAAGPALCRQAQG